MLISKNINLKPFNTFGIDCLAKTLISINTEKEARSIFRNEIAWEKPLQIMGGGSNILFTTDFRGTILYPDFTSLRVEMLEKDHVIVSAGSGVEWDTFTAWCVEMGFSGPENLSGIPGSVGAVPVQNIGAYGTDVKEIIVKVRAISTSDGKLRIFKNAECGFGYRTSIFKTSARGKYLITRVYFRLRLKFIPKLGYGSLNEEVGKLGKATLKNVREAVLKIRKNKLPDPFITGNAGSFFKNPVIDNRAARELTDNYPDIPVYDDDSGKKKLAAGWLIEQCGWKGFKSGNAGVHDKQALVLVNLGNARGIEIFELSEKIRESVKNKFGIQLEREVEVIGIT